MKSFVSLAIVTLAVPLSSQAQDASPTPKEYRHQSMSGRDFSGKDLGESKFFRVRLNGANFSGANLTNATFQQCDLAGSDFSKAVFGPGTKFTQCTMNEANLEGLDMRGADFEKVNLRGANLRNTKGWGDISDSTFAGADLRGADFSGVKDALKDVQWKGAIYDETTKFPASVDPVKAGAEKASS